MSDTNLIEDFSTARDYLLDIIQPSLEVYVCGIFDPLNMFCLLRDIKKVMHTHLQEVVPDLPKEFYPQLLLSADEDSKVFEFCIQNYLNKVPSLKFLGACEYGGVLHDMYYSDLCDIEPWFVSRYGHSDENEFSGATAARSEYHLGITSPLSIAYQMAIDNGCIAE